MRVVLHLPQKHAHLIVTDLIHGARVNAAFHDKAAMGNHQERGWTAADDRARADAWRAVAKQLEDKIK